MKNVLIILTLLFTTHFFNDLQAQAKVGLVNTTGDGTIIDDDEINKLHLQHFKALSRDDCEKAITLVGTIEIIDIPEPWETPSSQAKTKASSKRKQANRGRSKSPNAGAFTSEKTQDEAHYRKYSFPPTKGNTVTFNTSDIEPLDIFSNQFFVVFTFQDIDRCTRNGKQPVDLQPQGGIYESLKLYVNYDEGKIRLANDGKLTGTIVGETNKYFTVGGNPNLVPNVEAGEIRLKISKTKKNNGPGSLSNGG